MAQSEKFTARAITYRGGVVWTGTAGSIDAAIALADAEAPQSYAITIRGEFTSDGTHWPGGRGRVVAIKDETSGRKWART